MEEAEVIGVIGRPRNEGQQIRKMTGLGFSLRDEGFVPKIFFKMWFFFPDNSEKGLKASIFF